MWVQSECSWIFDSINHANVHLLTSRTTTMSVFAPRRKQRTERSRRKRGGETKSSAFDTETTDTPTRVPRVAVPFDSIEKNNVDDFLTMLREISQYVERSGTFEQEVALCVCYLLRVSESLALRFYSRVDFDNAEQTATIAKAEVVLYFNARHFFDVFGHVLINAQNAQDWFSRGETLDSKAAACRSVLDERIKEIESAQKSARGDALPSAYDMLLRKMTEIKLNF